MLMKDEERRKKEASKVKQTTTQHMYNLVTYRRLLVDGLDDKLLVVERDVSDLAPREPNLRGELVFLLVDVEPEGIHTQPEVCALLVLDGEIVDSVHLQVLRNLQVLQHGILPGGGGEGKGGGGGKGRGKGEGKLFLMY